MNDMAAMAMTIAGAHGKKLRPPHQPHSWPRGRARTQQQQRPDQKGAGVGAEHHTQGWARAYCALDPGTNQREGEGGRRPPHLCQLQGCRCAGCVQNRREEDLEAAGGSPMTFRTILKTSLPFREEWG